MRPLDNDTSKTAPPVRRPLPNPHVIFKRLGEEIVLFHLKTDRFYELNATAARYWELLAKGCDSAQIREHMLDEFVVDPDELLKEFESLLTALRQQDLVTDHA